MQYLFVGGSQHGTMRTVGLEQEQRDVRLMRATSEPVRSPDRIPKPIVSTIETYKKTTFEGLPMYVCDSDRQSVLDAALRVCYNLPRM